MAQPISTHYDNLKVARDAQLEVIKRAYRKLSQKYHPDRNPDPAALEIMKMINLAWDVLSDPERRARHDRAIVSLERRAAQTPRTATASVKPGPARSAARANARRHGETFRMAGVLALLILLLSVAVFQFSESDSQEDSSAVQTVAPDTHDTHDTHDMVGVSDRVPHGYLSAVVQDHSPGIAVVDIDNTRGLADAEVRLFLNGRAARSVFVHHGKRFTVDQLAPGKYVVKYKLEVGGKLHAFQERATFQPQRDKFSKLRIVLPDAAQEIALDQF